LVGTRGNSENNRGVPRSDLPAAHPVNMEARTKRQIEVVMLGANIDYPIGG